MEEGPRETPADRSPEEAFLDPLVAEVLARGNQREIRRALVARREEARDPPERFAIDEMLANPRLFATPVDGAPSLFTLNGVGTLLLGHKAPDPRDGSYIATLFLCVFFIPVCPLSQYVVRAAGSSAYQFMARVPVGPIVRWWRRLFVGALAVLVAGIVTGSIGAWSRGIEHSFGQTSPLYLLNGLDGPVTVTIDETPVTVPSRGRIARPLPAGRYSVAARTEQGTVLDRRTIEIVRGRDLVVYNVLGASPLFIEDIEYVERSSRRSSTGGGPPPVLHLLCGAECAFVSEEGIDYVFRTPPAEISRAETRRHADVGGDRGWRDAVAWLADEGEVVRAARLAEAIFRAEPDAVDALLWAADLRFEAGEAEDALALAEATVREHPDFVWAHTICQDALRRLGRTAEAQERYRTLERESPGAMAAFLRVRIEPQDDALPLLAQAVSAYPGDAFLRGEYGWRLFLARDFMAAEDQFYAWSCLPGPCAWRELSAYVRTVVALGYAVDALKWLGDYAALPGSAVDLDFAVLYGRVARLAGDPTSLQPHDHFVAEVPHLPEDTAAYALWYRVRTGRGGRPQQIPSGASRDIRDALRIEMAARSDPVEAAVLAARARPAVLSLVEETTRVLVACEAGRRGEARALRLLGTLPDVHGPEREALERFIVGNEEGWELRNLDLEIQAAIHFARARRAADAASRDRLLQAARADDVLRGVVTEAIEGWPAP